MKYGKMKLAGNVVGMWQNRNTKQIFVEKQKKLAEHLEYNDMIWYDMIWYDMIYI
jgi:hypothetical protein